MKQTSIKALICGVFAAMLLAVPLVLYSADKPQEQTPKKIYTAVEKHASFPGGDVALFSFLHRNLRYPEQAQIDSIQGRVIVRFVVNEEGSIEQVSIAKSVSEELDQEAVRVIKLMPKWEPGLNNGTPVSTYFTLPITFRLPPKSEN